MKTVLVCGASGFIGKNVLERLLARPDLKVVAALLRPADVTLQVPDTSKFERETGWKPRYSFADSVEHLLSHWRARVKAGLA